MEIETKSAGEDTSPPTERRFAWSGFTAMARPTQRYRWLHRAAFAVASITAMAAIPLAVDLWGGRGFDMVGSGGAVQQPLPSQPPQPTRPESTAGAQLAVAHWVLGIGGTLQISRMNYWQTINSSRELPPGPISVMTIQLGGNQQIRDHDLERLEAITALNMLWLGGTRVGDAALVHVQAMQELRLLGLSGTRVTDEGLVHLKTLAHLSTLLLDDTAVSDEGLGHLHGLNELEELALNGTAVSEQGIAALQAALPDCRIVSRRQTRGMGKVADAVRVP